MKACKRCGSDTNGFYPQARNKDGLRSYCKMCDKAQNRITYQRNKELLKAKREKLKTTNMIKDEKLRAILKAQTKNLHSDDTRRLYDFIAEIKNDEPELSEFDQVTKAFAMLITETTAASDGLKSMAKDMRVFDEIGIPFVSEADRFGLTIDEIKEAHRKKD